MNLRELQFIHQAKAVSKRVIRGGAAGEALANMVAGLSGEALTQNVSGTVRQVFVLGVHDPDSTTTNYYVP